MLNFSGGNISFIQNSNKLTDTIRRISPQFLICIHFVIKDFAHQSIHAGFEQLPHTTVFSHFTVQYIFRPE